MFNTKHASPSAEANSQTLMSLPYRGKTKVTQFPRQLTYTRCNGRRPEPAAVYPHFGPQTDEMPPRRFDAGQYER